jgi:hypothetical protein
MESDSASTAKEMPGGLFCRIWFFIFSSFSLGEDAVIRYMPAKAAPD